MNTAELRRLIAEEITEGRYLQRPTTPPPAESSTRWRWPAR